MAVWLPTTVALESSLLRPSTSRPEAHAPVGTGRALRSRGRVASGLGVGTALSLVLLPQQSSNSKKDKDALEDRKRNPLLRYIGKPRSSSQSSESMGTAAGWGHSPAGPLRDRRPHQPQPSSGGPAAAWSSVPLGGRALRTAVASTSAWGSVPRACAWGFEVFSRTRLGAQRPLVPPAAGSMEPAVSPCTRPEVAVGPRRRPQCRSWGSARGRGGTHGQPWFGPRLFVFQLDVTFILTLHLTFRGSLPFSFAFS